ncbi:pyridoxamine kinase [Aerococcaceae bacterium DSM 111021]|nr:pyridoxamine kinase [Aerococcaceae bacterium DSM 111021]
MSKRVLVVNDIPGAGKVAANINIPILSAGGMEVSVLPTMFVSTQTGESYSNIIRHEMNEDFRRTLDVWKNNDIHFDVILTGYFSTIEQLELFTEYYLQEKVRNPEMKLLMDPIMADNGKYYPGFDHRIAEKFSALMKQADIVFPNITEACFITNTPYSELMTVEELNQVSLKLIESGVQYVVITGVRVPESNPNQIGFYVRGQNDYNRLIMHKYYPEHFFGTGDIVVSSATVWFSRGYSIEDTLLKTGKIIEQSLDNTLALNRDIKWGIYFEPILNQFFPINDKERSF